MGWLRRILHNRLRPTIERGAARQLVEQHWPAIEKTLREEFPGPELGVALKAGRKACERLVEHAL